MSLSDTDVKKERLQAKPYKLSDSGGLSLGHACRRQALALVLRFEGKHKTMTFGRYPELYLALARDGHRQARRVLAAKVDPIEERKTERQAKHVSIANSFVSVVPKQFRALEERLRCYKP